MARRIWNRVPTLATLAIILAVATTALAGTLVDQGRPGSNTPGWKIQAQGGSWLASGAPTFGGASGNISVTSAAFCSLTPGACYMVSCATTVTFRTGAATPTALTTDNPFFGPLSRPICLGASETCIAFIVASGTTTCSGSLTRSSP